MPDLSPAVELRNLTDALDATNLLHAHRQMEALRAAGDHDRADWYQERLTRLSSLTWPEDRQCGSLRGYFAPAPHPMAVTDEVDAMDPLRGMEADRG